jgi:hypothetical protein
VGSRSDVGAVIGIGSTRRETGEEEDGVRKGVEGNDREEITWALTHRYLSAGGARVGRRGTTRTACSKWSCVARPGGCERTILLLICIISQKEKGFVVWFHPFAPKIHWFRSSYRFNYIHLSVLPLHLYSFGLESL